MADFRVLGPLEVSDGDGVLDIGGPKPRAVVALLVAAAGEVVSADVLIDGVWGEAPPDSAANSLQTYVSRLRGVLGGGAIVSQAPM